MICKILKGRWLILVLAFAVWCMGCAGNDDFTLEDDFEETPLEAMPERIETLKRLFPKALYEKITKDSRNHPGCIESHNREELKLSEKPNGQWYYTYDNLIEGMAKLEEFAAEGTDNTRKLEIAAFLANVAQETGAKVPGDPYGSPCCFIQEGGGAYWRSCNFGGCVDTDHGKVGYGGRGPHQLTHDYNYKKFGEAMGVGDKYLKDPDLLTKNPKIGIAGSIWFWGHTEWGRSTEYPFKPSPHNVVTGKWKPSPNDLKCGRKTPNFGVIINIINGGIECGKGEPTPQAAARVKYLKAIAGAMDVRIPDGFLDDCSSQQPFNPCFSYD